MNWNTLFSPYFSSILVMLKYRNGINNISQSIWESAKYKRWPLCKVFLSHISIPWHCATQMNKSHIVDIKVTVITINVNKKSHTGKHKSSNNSQSAKSNGYHLYHFYFYYLIPMEDQFILFNTNERNGPTIQTQVE